MIKVESKGFDEIRKWLNEMSQKAKELDGKQQSVPLSKLLNEDFMREHTDFPSFDSLLSGSPFRVETKEDFEAIPNDQWDTYVSETTQFVSWEEMQTAAAATYLAKQIGL